MNKKLSYFVILSFSFILQWKENILVPFSLTGDG